MNDLTPELLKALETIAEKATPGPWRYVVPGPSRENVLTHVPAEQDWREGTLAISHVSYRGGAADWEYIAATSPDVVLALVAAARERNVLREDCRLRDLDNVRLADAAIVRLRAEVDRLRRLAPVLREFAAEEAECLGKQSAGALEQIASELEGIPEGQS